MNIKKVKPLFNHIICTMNKYTDADNEGSLIDIHKISGAVKEYQTVVAVGSMVRDIKVGDIVLINPIRYSVMKHEAGSLKDGVITDNPVIRYNFKTVELNHIPHLILVDQDIVYVIEEYENDAPKHIIDTPKIII